MSLTLDEARALGVCWICESRDPRPDRQHVITGNPDRPTAIQCSARTEAVFSVRQCPITGAFISQESVFVLDEPDPPTSDEATDPEVPR